uniref:FERM domain-containing protein n=1 Tax=Heterorhabditis bacteriophora TaxID=37862 RepID=A0A1I7X866_HETBA
MIYSRSSYSQLPQLRRIRCSGSIDQIRNIIHLNKRTTYSDPRQLLAPEGIRRVRVRRRAEIGYGFVAAGQQPTIIQFVSPVEQLPPRPRSARRNCRVRFTDHVLVSSLSESIGVILIFSIMRSRSHFALALEYSLGARSSRIGLLRSTTTIESIVTTPNSDHLRCVLRFVFIPKDVHALWREDQRALDYYYVQCTNDVVRGRFAFEMRYEACVRLAALHMQQVAIESNILKDGCVSASRMEKEYGLETFVPEILLDNVKKRDIRKHLRFYMKKDNSKLTECLIRQCRKMGEQPSLPSICTHGDVPWAIRLRYLDLVSHLPSFGGRSFSVTFKENHVEMIMQIDPRYGLLMRHPGKPGRPTVSIDFDIIDGLMVRRETEIVSIITIKLANNPAEGLEFLIDKDDIDDLIMYITGYKKVNCDMDLLCEIDESPPLQREPPNTHSNLAFLHLAPPYFCSHAVTPSGWNYCGDTTLSEQLFNLSNEPPSYELANSFVEVHMEQMAVDKALKRPNLNERMKEETSDSSDTEDSSKNLSLPILNGDLKTSNGCESRCLKNNIPSLHNSQSRSDAFLGLFQEDHLIRKESVETLIHSVHALQISTLSDSSFSRHDSRSGFTKYTIKCDHSDHEQNGLDDWIRKEENKHLSPRNNEESRSKKRHSSVTVI